VFENRVLSRVFGPKKDEVTGEWRKLHNEELSDLYSLPNIVRVVESRRMRWAGHVARMGERRGVYRVLVGKLEGRRPWRDPDRPWGDPDVEFVLCVYRYVDGLLVVYTVSVVGLNLQACCLCASACTQN
jgi:hypothetical protein